MDEELRDEQWELIAPLLLNHKKRGRPRAEDRRTLNGILLWQAQDRFGCLDPVLAGRTYHQSMAADPLATVGSRSGKTREFGKAFD